MPQADIPDVIAGGGNSDINMFAVFFSQSMSNSIFSKMHELPAIPNLPELAGQRVDMVLFYAKVRKEVEAILQNALSSPEG